MVSTCTDLNLPFLSPLECALLQPVELKADVYVRMHEQIITMELNLC